MILLRRWGRSRAALLGATLLLGLVLGLWWRGGGASWEALLRDHGVQSVVAIRWLDEPSPGQWGVALAEVVPTAIENESAQGRRDVILFQGQVGGDGEPHRVRGVGNLTRTPDADDTLLALNRVQGQARALVGSKVGQGFGSFQALNLEGDPGAFVDEQGQRRRSGDRLKLGLLHWQEKGQPQGVEQRVYVLEEPAQDLQGRFDDTTLVMHAQQRGQQRWATLSLEDGAPLQVHDAELKVHLQPQAVTVESWTQFTVNRVRSIPWVGTSRIALLEKYVFNHVDRARQLWYGAVGVDQAQLAAEINEGGQEEPPPQEQEPPLLQASKEAISLGEAGQWPPPDLAPPAAGWPSGAVEGEGRWRPWRPAWAKGKPGRPWPVVRTSVRVNRAKEYEFVTLVAMDMRQLDLHLLAGSVNPRSTTGLRGTGLIPREPEVLGNLLLAFNGGFKTSHGAFGMVLDRKVFVPPKSAMATLGLLDDGAVRMGSWPGEAPTGHYRTEQRWQVEVDKNSAPIPEDVVSLRQNLPPLVGQGKLNPLGARRWGGPVAHLSHTSTPRSAVCIRGNGTLMFVWGHRCSASELGEAMLLAGCSYGMHLDMNPFHSGLTMYHVPVEGGQLPPEDKKLGFVGAEAETPTRKMQFDKYRYLGRDIKDFFYVTWRSLLPERLGAQRSGLPWSQRGLPVARDGLEPLALSASTEQGVRLLALAPGHFLAQRQAASEDPATGQGAVRVRLVLDAPQSGQGALYVSPEGVLDVASSPAPPKGVWPGAVLVQGGEARQGWPKVEQPVVAARTRQGDLLLGQCEGCSLDALMEAMAPSGLQEAVLLGSGRLEVASQGQEEAWKAVLGATGAPPEQELRLSPARVSPRVGLSGFEGRDELGAP